DLHDGPSMRLLKLGRIDYVDDLVAASDLVITKSGGLIVSEILARGTPMVVIDPIPGQEEWNADFVAGSGAGLQLRQATRGAGYRRARAGRVGIGRLSVITDLRGREASRRLAPRLFAT
ncbi:MAG TPA: glycosyltransferase, partial [Roseiflexaceae bacterium]|nr:glycosyltransferase [Roseiflexaceae bacterium]